VVLLLDDDDDDDDNDDVITVSIVVAKFLIATSLAVIVGIVNANDNDVAIIVLDSLILATDRGAV